VTAKPAAVTATRRTDAVAVIAGLVTVMLWGSAFVGIRAAGEAFSPGALGVGRLLVSSAILGAVALVRREPVPRGRDMLAIAAYGVLWLGVHSVTLNAAERHVDAGTAAMIINTGPILIAVLAGIFLREGFPHPKPELCTDDRAKRPGAVTKPPARPTQATGPASSPP